MIQENEIVMLMLGIGVLILALGNRFKLRRLPSWPILIAGYFALFTGWVLTILEGYFWEGLFNYLEHLAYAVSAVLVATWSWKALIRKRVKR